MRCDEKQNKINVFDQILWERDVALDQLKEIGFGLGETMWHSALEAPRKCGDYLVLCKISDDIKVPQIATYNSRWFINDEYLNPIEIHDVVKWMKLPSDRRD